MPIIIDETKEETLTSEELEEIERKERLKKIIHKPVLASNFVSLLIKIILAVAVLGIIISMWFTSGTILVISIIVITVCSVINYLFYHE